jgi:hypothetical protein
MLYEIDGVKFLKLDTYDGIRLFRIRDIVSIGIGRRRVRGPHAQWVNMPQEEIDRDKRENFEECTIVVLDKHFNPGINGGGYPQVYVRDTLDSILKVRIAY